MALTPRQRAALNAFSAASVHLRPGGQSDGSRSVLLPSDAAPLLGDILHALQDTQAEAGVGTAAWVNLPLRTAVSATVTDMVYLGGLWLAWGASGALVTSQDGINWTARNSTFGTTPIVSIAYGNGVYVIAAGQKLATSPDGITWTARTTPNSQVSKLAFGAGVFALCGAANNENVWTSPDGITWTARPTGVTAMTFQTIAFADGYFMITTSANISNSFLKQYATSPDGITWTAYQGWSQGLTKTAYGNGVYVVGGILGQGYYSTNLTDWGGLDLKLGNASNLNGVVFLNDLFLAFNQAGGISTSSDGITWTARTSGLSGVIANIAYGAGVYVAVDSTGALASSPDGITWTAQNSQFGASAINNVRFLNDLFIAVGAAGKLSTSADGLTWTAQTTPFQAQSMPIYDVTFGNSTYVICGQTNATQGTSQHVASSPDAVTWTIRSTGWSNATAVAIGVVWDSTNSLFIVIANGVSSGRYATSPDGTTWTNRATNISGVDQPIGIATNGGVTVVTATSSKISKTTDGATWANQTTNYTGAATAANINFVNGLFVASGGYATGSIGGGDIVTSPDGTTWTNRSVNLTGYSWNSAAARQIAVNGHRFILTGTTQPSVLKHLNSISSSATAQSPQAGGLQINDVAYGAGVYVAVGNGGMISSSTDGVIWVARTSNLGSNNVVRVAYGAGIFVAVGASGATATSPDGVTWTSRDSGFGSNALVAVLFNANLFVAAGNVGVGYMSSSADGTTWSPAPADFGTTGFRGMAYGNGVYVVGGNSGYLVSSPNATTWTYRESTFIKEDINDVTFAAGTFVAVGNAGKLAVSTDGIIWVAKTSQFGTDNITGVKFLNNIFIAWGANGKISTSTDGLVWTARTSQFSTNAVNAVIYAGDQFVAVGAAGALSTSPDGTTWTAQVSNFDVNAINDIAWGNGIYVIGGDSGFVATSPDATTWTLRDSLVTGNVGKIAYGAGTFVISMKSGSPGLTISVDDGTTWSLFTSRYTATGNTDALIFTDDVFVLNASGIPSVSEDGAFWLKRGAEAFVGPSGVINMQRLNGVLMAIGSTSTQLTRALAS